MIKRFLLAIFSVALLSFSMHKFYVSITEASYNQETTTFELSIKFIGHDLEKALSAAGAPELYLGTDNENKKANKLIENYIQQRLQFVINNKELNWKMIGKEVNDDDFIYCYIESEKVGIPKSITIKNTLLTEVFAAQKNAVYLHLNGEQKTFNFHKGSSIEKYKVD